jgi:hypothetical protein
MIHGMGRKPNPFDARDYHLSDAVGIVRRMRCMVGNIKEIAPVLWSCERVLNQGTQPYCVGYAWAGFGNAMPVFADLRNSDGDALYYAAKEIDGEPLKENGSCTRSGAEAYKKIGRIQTYAFTTSMTNIKNWLVTHGPVIVGTSWYNTMFEPDSDGFVYPKGELSGGHECLIIGYNPQLDVFTFLNSWGDAWGINGRFKMHAKDWAGLLEDQGDAVVTLDMVPEDAKLVFATPEDITLGLV